MFATQQGGFTNTATWQCAQGDASGNLANDDDFYARAHVADTGHTVTATITRTFQISAAGPAVTPAAR